MLTIGRCFMSIVISGAIVVVADLVTNMIIEMKTNNSIVND